MRLSQLISNSYKLFVIIFRKVQCRKRVSSRVATSIGGSRPSDKGVGAVIQTLREGGGGGAVSPNFFLALRVSVWPQNTVVRGGALSSRGSASDYYWWMERRCKPVSKSTAVECLRREACKTPFEASCLICSSFRISLGSSPLKFHLSQILGTGLVPSEKVLKSYMAFCFYIL